jgi:endonuclease III
MLRDLSNERAQALRPFLFQVETILRARFGQPRHGNKSNPLDELFYILLSLQTTEINCRRSYQALRKAFPRWSMLVRASVPQIRRPISFAGLGRQRALKISNIARTIHRQYGRLSLSRIKYMTSEQAEAYLTSLPGIGKKTARCILMYSLNRPVFPLDTHCARILKRLGFPIPSGSLRQCEDEIQNLIPAEIRCSLHVTMIDLGRRICTNRNPKCPICPLQSICPTGQEMTITRMSPDGVSH